MRLGSRLKEIAMQHVASFPARERLELDEFFRRTFATMRHADGSRADGGQRARPAPVLPVKVTQAERTDDA